jgi:nucleoside-diphosphate-sugar epimerase
VDATMASLLEENKERSVYNISDGQQYDRYALANYFKELSGKKAYRFYLPEPLIKIVASVMEAGSVFLKNAPVMNKEKIKELTAANWNCSIDAARLKLNYKPQYSLRTGLSETLDWYKENKWL